jgi:hypothetical protein
MSWSEEYQRKQGQKLARRVQRTLARLDSPTPVEAARATLASKAINLALDHRALSIKELAGRLNALIAQEPELEQAAATLQTDLLSVEIRRIVRDAKAKAPSVKRLSRLLKDSQSH